MSIFVFCCIILMSEYKHSLTTPSIVTCLYSPSGQHILKELSIYSDSTLSPHYSSKPTPSSLLSAHPAGCTLAPVTSDIYIAKANCPFSVVRFFPLLAEFDTIGHSVLLDSIPSFRFHGATLSQSLSRSTDHSS